MCTTFICQWAIDHCLPSSITWLGLCPEQQDPILTYWGKDSNRSHVYQVVRNQLSTMNWTTMSCKLSITMNWQNMSCIRRAQHNWCVIGTTNSSFRVKNLKVATVWWYTHIYMLFLSEPLFYVDGTGWKHLSLDSLYQAISSNIAQTENRISCGCSGTTITCVLTVL